MVFGLANRLTILAGRKSDDMVLIDRASIRKVLLFVAHVALDFLKSFCMIFRTGLSIVSSLIDDLCLPEYVVKKIASTNEVAWHRIHLFFPFES